MFSQRRAKRVLIVGRFAPFSDELYKEPHEFYTGAHLQFNCTGDRILSLGMDHKLDMIQYIQNSGSSWYQNQSYKRENYSIEGVERFCATKTTNKIAIIDREFGITIGHKEGYFNKIPNIKGVYCSVTNWDTVIIDPQGRLIVQVTEMGTNVKKITKYIETDVPILKAQIHEDESGIAPQIYALRTDGRLEIITLNIDRSEITEQSRTIIAFPDEASKPRERIIDLVSDGVIDNASNIPGTLLITDKGRCYARGAIWRTIPGRLGIVSNTLPSITAGGTQFYLNYELIDLPSKVIRCDMSGNQVSFVTEEGQVYISGAIGEGSKPNQVIYDRPTLTYESNRVVDTVNGGWSVFIRIE